MIHIAGHPIQYGTLLRQRCAWCGAIMIDDDLSLMASISSDGSPFKPLTWETNALVRIEGANPVTSEVIPESEHQGKIPPGCCAFKPEPLKLVQP